MSMGNHITNHIMPRWHKATNLSEQRTRHHHICCKQGFFVWVRAGTAYLEMKMTKV